MKRSKLLLGDIKVVLALRIIAGIFLGIWLILMLLGKGGFVHFLLMSAVGIEAVDLACLYRGRVTTQNSAH